MTTSDFRPTSSTIYTASVVEVDPESYTMRVFSKQKGITMPLEIPSLFTNIRGGKGSGGHILPEVGAEVWICETSDGTQIPLSYHGVIGEGSYRNGRPGGIPGDIVFSTLHGNSFKVLKGGSIVSQASPGCSFVLDSASDSIKQFSSQHFRYCLSSTEEHRVKYQQQRDCQTGYQYFYNADDETESVSVTIGSDNSSVYRLTVKDRSADFNSTFTTDLYANGDGVVVGSDLHANVELCTVGTKEVADFVLNSTQFLSDLATLCTALQQIGSITPIAALITSGDAPTVSAVGQISAAANSILGKISSGVYPTTKLKSE